MKTTTLKNIFAKPVDRPIEGVIKADDEQSLRLELEEYVLTKEVEKRLESFLGAYNNYEGANGVWVSGFFGSGKSHLLKILALLLENRQIDGIHAVDLFLPKCGVNDFLRADLKRAISIPSRSILFNIDQKADVISKTQIDALLAVFVKVFDEMSGYYGKQGHIAQFERDLDSRQLYDKFKKTYQKRAGRDWSNGREQALLESTNIAEAYAEVTGTDKAQAIGILDKYRTEYKVSIEDFAEKVQRYIDSQVPGFRLNFFVDEVGQYIAENVKLMTNLQTIAESLATKSRGRAWVIVTAQEDMVTVVGEMGKQQGNDFSKIQARFATRMKLTSADVEEVIQKRLLTKDDAGVSLLSEIYRKEANNFKTLFDFADGSQQYRNFADKEHFIHSYPFIPYQFSLFQSAIQNLSLHNAFEGKHSSVGERSMLGVFQQVAIQIGSHEIGQLATFDLMFEGIRSALKSNIQRAIIQAEKNLDDQFTIRLLKTLFLVKYVKEFKPTLRNLCVLMLEGFQQDLPSLRKRVEESLDLLEQQTYIERSGEHFHYLTDEEKDIEQNIKNTDVEVSDVATELEKLVFDGVIKTRKIRYEANSQDYTFTKKLDDKLHGREYELAIHVVSPLHDQVDSESLLQMQSMGRDELLVLMAPDNRLVHELKMYKRTEKYIRQNISVTQQEAVQRILKDKGFQNRERLADLQQAVQSSLSKAKIFVAGTEVDTGAGEAQARIIRGFHDLIARTYPNLQMLHGMSYTDSDIGKCLKRSKDGLFANDAISLTESEQEILSVIQGNSRGGVRTTIKSLIEKFEKKPYGWSYYAILCVLANLYARGKVELRADGNLLDDNDIEKTMKNSNSHGNVVIEPQVEFTASQVRALKEFYEDFFDAPPHTNEAKSLGRETELAFKELLAQIQNLSTQISDYPFLTVLQPVIYKLKELAGKQASWYLTDLSPHESSLVEIKAAIIDPIRKFMSGPQKTIYDEAKKFVQEQESNFAYIEGGQPVSLIQTLTDPECFKGTRIQPLKGQVEDLKHQITVLLRSEIEIATASVATLRERLCNMPEFFALTKEQKATLEQPFTEHLESLERQKLVAVVREAVRRFEESDYQKLLAQMSLWAQKEASPPTPNGGDKGNSAANTGTKSSPIEYIPIRSIKIQFDKAWLADDADIERYIATMKEALLLEIKNGKRVQI